MRGARKPAEAVSTMRPLLRLACLVVVLLASAGLVRAGMSYDESAAFSFDTRDYFAGLAAESAVFTFDTRAVDGLQGTAVSGVFPFDTQFANVSALTVAGPATLAAGGLAQFTCSAVFTNGSQHDVTTGAVWSLSSDAPHGVSIGSSGIVQVPVGLGGGSFKVRASYQSTGGQRFGELAVVLGGAFTVQAGHTVQSLGGSAYRVQLSATAASASGTVTYRWDTNGDGVYGDLVGASVSWPLTSQGGRYDVRVEATDAANHHAYATRSVMIDKPAVANQPAKLAPVSTAGGSSLLDIDGQPLRSGVGLIVITHDIEETGDESWVHNLAAAIDQRLPTADKPNIVIYDWREDSYLLRLDLGLVGTGTETAEMLTRYAAAAKWVKFKYGFVGKASEYLGFLGDLVDIAQRTEAALAPYAAYLQGLNLHDRLITESLAVPPRVDFSKPIHFIGKGAGGNVVAQAALSLKWDGKDVDRVTLLDTTMPDPVYYKELPNPTVVEHITSSYKGDMEWPQTWLTQGGTYLKRDIIMDSLPEYFGSVFLDLLGGLPIIGGLAQDLAGLPSAHDLAPWWYRNTAVPAQGLETRGFYNSPFLYGPKVPHNLPTLAAGRFALSPTAGGAAVNFLGGFSSFGSVSLTGGVYALVEASDAGIFQTIAVPGDVEKLRFKFRFTGTSDGDCLAVRFGARRECYVAQDLAATHGSFTTAEISFWPYAGLTDQLVFTLVSRGQSGASVEIKEIEILQNDDVDGDGLTTAQELAAGTNPQSPDTDGDGLDDWYEINVSHTNPAFADSDGDGQSDFAELAAGTDPMDSHSVFAVTEFSRAGGGFLLRWSALTGKTYRILRSTTVDFASIDVIASGLVGVAPTTSYNDTTISTVTTPTAFYRIEAE